MTYPHNFQAIISGDTPPLLLVGAGLSYPYVQAQKLIPSLRQSPPPESATCKNTGKCFGRDKGVNSCLYCLAEKRLAELEILQTAKENPRYLLADRMDLFNDTWLGNAGLPLGRNFARHRAIARLAIDRRFHSIVSLNWDLYLEAAFEAAGIPRNAIHPARQALEVGGYVVVVRDAQQASAVNTKLFLIMKPHGCRFDLEQQRHDHPDQEPVLKVTYKDLESLKTQLAQENNADVTYAIKRDLKGRALVAVGWSASEPYLSELIENLSGSLPTTGEDRLSVVIKDDDWRANHDRIARCYATDQVSSYFPMPNEQDTDRLFRWIYARFGLRHLVESVPASQSDVSATLSALAGEMKEPTQHNWCLDFFDDFLPAWARMCWRMGGVEVFRNGAAIPPHQVPAGPRDWHVPFNTHPNSKPGLGRPDLAAAAMLLSALNAVSKSLAWDFASFPGALWRDSDGLLVIPVPMFVPAHRIETVGSLKSMVDTWRMSARFACLTDNMRLLPIGPDGDARSVTKSIWQPLVHRFGSDVRRNFSRTSMASFERAVYDDPLGLQDL